MKVLDLGDGHENGDGEEGVHLNEKSKDKVPLLFVDVNLGSNRTERIVVYEGDRSEDLAESFGNLHSRFSALQGIY